MISLLGQNTLAQLESRVLGNWPARFGAGERPRGPTYRYLSGELKAGIERPRAGEQQRHRGNVGQRGGRRQLCQIGQGQRRHEKGMLAAQDQVDAARLCFVLGQQPECLSGHGKCLAEVFWQPGGQAAEGEHLAALVPTFLGPPVPFGYLQRRQEERQRR
jgi:hypothetical protein